MKDVGQHTRLTPDQRENFLQKFLRNVNEKEEIRSILSGWGYKLDTCSIQLEARLMPREELLFGGGQKELVNPQADWTRSATTKRCLNPVQVDRWIYVYPKKDEKAAFTFFKILQREARKVGIKYAEPQVYMCLRPTFIEGVIYKLWVFRRG